MLRTNRFVRSATWEGLATFEQIKQGKGVSCVPLAPEAVDHFFPRYQEPFRPAPRIRLKQAT
jgi:hypothetical protein